MSRDHGALLATVLLACAVSHGRADDDRRAASVLANGSFEKLVTLRNAADLRRRGFDLGPAGKPVRWADGWTINTATNPATVRIVAAPGAPEGQKHYLHVETTGGTHVYTRGGEAGRTYYWRLWARGEPLQRDGKTIRPVLTVCIYEYAIDELGGRPRFIGSNPIKRLRLGTKWAQYRGTLKTRRAHAKQFGFLLAFTGSVSVDCVELQASPFASGAVARPTPLKRLFYLPLDAKPDAAEAAGCGKATVVGQLTFAEGKLGRAAVFASGAHLEFDAHKNFDQNEGTLAVWVKPFWDNDDGKAHCLFEVPVPPYAFIDSGFVLTKGFTNRIAPGLTYVLNGPPWHAVSSHVRSWQAQRWMHVTLTWSQRAGILRLYVNGERVGEAAKPFAERPASKGRRLIVGARLGGRPPAAPTDWPVTMGNLERDYPPEGACSADAIIDELQIFNRMVTPQEAWRLAGGTGPPPKPTSKPLTPETITTLPHDLETPHVPFAKPLMGGPVEALFLVSPELARDVVELWQRLDLAYDAFLLNGGYRGGPLKYPKHAQRYYRGMSDRERIAELMKKLDRKPPVIVLVAMDLKRTPRHVVNRLLALVRGGTGLVIASRSVRPEPFLQKEDPAGHTAVTAGIPWSGLPECFPGEDLPLAQWPKRAVSTYTLGKGRVVRIRYRSTPAKPPGWMLVEDGLTPGLHDRTYTRQWDARYGRYLSLVAKAIVWAAGRKPRCALEMPPDGIRFAQADLPRQSGLVLNVKHPPSMAIQVDTTIRDPLGTMEHASWHHVKCIARVVVRFPPTTRPAPDQDDRVTDSVKVDVPRLKAGLHYLDVVIRVGGKTADWGSVAFRVDTPEAIDAIRLDRPSVERGQSVTGTVAFHGAVAQDADLTVRAIDTNDRVYAETRQRVRAGAKAVPFKLRLDDPSTIATTVQAELKRGARILSQQEVVVFVPKRNLDAPEADEFASIGWQSSVVTTGAGMHAFRQLRRAGFNIGLLWPKGANERNLAMWDMVPLPCMTHLKVRPDTRGWTKPPAGHPGIQDGSYANPKVKEAIWQGVRSHIGQLKHYGPFFYSLGDEDTYQGELGFSPWGLKAYRRYLADRYRSIDRLNREWGAGYRSFDEVPRLKAGQAKARHHVPGMIDHRGVQEMVWREMFVHLQNKIREYDPHAKAGAEGSMSHDVEAMLGALGVWGPYADRRIDVLMRSVAKPSNITGHWYGHYCRRDQIPRAAAVNLWKQLFRGCGNTSFYFLAGVSRAGEGNLMADFSYTPFFRTQLPDFRLVMDGVGQLLRTCAPKETGVAIHWSQPSRLGLDADEAFGTPSEVDAPLIKIFEKHGLVNWRYVTGRQLRGKAATALAHRAIFLPVSQCLSEGEARTLRRFVGEGGLLVGIGPVGSRTRFGRKLPAGQLDDVFGVHMNAPSQSHVIRSLAMTFDWKGRRLPLATTWNVVDRSIAPGAGKVLVQAAGVPVAVHSRHGKGDALLLNLNIARCDREPLARMIVALLAGEAVTPPVRFVPDTGDVSPYGMLEKGDLTLLGVLMDHRPGQWNGGTVILPKAMHVYDVKRGKYLGQRQQIAVAGQLDTQDAALFALQPDPITAVRVTAPDSVQRDKPMTIGCEVKAAGTTSCDGRVVRITLRGPEGSLRTHYRRMAYLGRGGRGRVTVEFALNDPTGTWEVLATDIASGVTARAKLVLR